MEALIIHYENFKLLIADKLLFQKFEIFFANYDYSTGFILMIPSIFYLQITFTLYYYLLYYVDTLFR